MALPAKRYNLEKLISFRRNMHEFPELSFEEEQTRENVIKYLLELGVPEKSMKKMAKTGLTVDIFGTAPPSGEPKLVAFRADMDGLELQELNTSLPYCSKKPNVAHMCGHDGHTTCLLGGASLILDHIHEIPSDKGIRLLFQPAEERIGGALPMINEGCLEGVSEVYGFHNWPQFGMPGKLQIKSGAVMSEVTVFKFKINGKGGHGSEPHKCKDPLQPILDFHADFRDLVKKHKANGVKFACTFPLLKSGSAFNVIPDSAECQGTLRTFDNDFTKSFIQEVLEIIREKCSQYGCELEEDVIILYPAILNTEKEAQHITRLGKEFFGPENVNEDKLPLYASEDFSFFVKERPGAFFFLGSGHSEDDPITPHNPRFNFNDDLIEKASYFWLRVAEDRLGVTFSKQK